MNIEESQIKSYPSETGQAVMDSVYDAPAEILSSKILDIAYLSGNMDRILNRPIIWFEDWIKVSCKSVGISLPCVIQIKSMFKMLSSDFWTIVSGHDKKTT